MHQFESFKAEGPEEAFKAPEERALS
jgi:hypothetical protein